MPTIHLSHTPGEIRIALTGDDGALLDYALWRPGAPDGLFDRYRARIAHHAPALAGYFVTLPADTGFLPDSAGKFAEGEGVAVRIVRAAQGGKGPRLAYVGAAPRDAPPGLIENGPSPLHRLAQAHPDAVILTDSPSLLPRLRQDFGARARLQADAFAAIEDDSDALADTWTDLPGGLRAGFFPTPALTAIDLDGGATTALRAPKAQVQFAANLAALPALARQIRLRNLSGIILIDPAGIATKRRRALEPTLIAALADDPAGPRLLGFTVSGLAEIQRPRLGPPLHELLAAPLGQGLAALRQLGRLLPRPGSAPPPGKPVLRAPPAIIAALRADPAALAEFETLYGAPPHLRDAQADTAPHCTLE